MSQVSELKPRNRPACPCGRGIIPPHASACEKCLHERADAFWKMLGTPGIPTERAPSEPLALKDAASARRPSVPATVSVTRKSRGK